MNIFSSLGHTLKRLRGQRQEGDRGRRLPPSLTVPCTLLSHPHDALPPLAGTCKSNSPRAGALARVVPTQLNFHPQTAAYWEKSLALPGQLLSGVDAA